MVKVDLELAQKAVNTIRMLSADAVEKAQAGHPGMPMGAAPMGFVLWGEHMKHCPEQPNWFNRDRFVLSAGHGSMLQYSLLHLFGYALPLEEIKQFRQWGSLTPGHPEVGHTAGVDATTGPLGQGFATAVGMAMAEAHLGAAYNRDGHDIIDHHTYVICGDGDLMEGISGEAASLAGHLKLGKLVVLYDSNDISLDGELGLAFSENVRLRFEGYGWDYLRVDDQNDLQSIAEAIQSARSDGSRPTLIEVKTTIAYGSPNKAGKGGHEGAHGTPLGADELKLTKQAIGWPEEPAFHIPDDVKQLFAQYAALGTSAYQDWTVRYAAYQQQYPELAKQLEQAIRGELPDGWDSALIAYPSDHKPISTRLASGETLNKLSASVPSLIGGSADLESSTFTHLNGETMFKPGYYGGRNIYYGVREFAMAAAVNGMMLHGGVKAFGGTFFVFSDYLKPAVRLAAIMNLPSVLVLTHDSIAVGEDGPTHQPIEQLAALRSMPNVTVIRPADANETIQAWRIALMRQDGPVCLVLSRQNLPVLNNAKLVQDGVGRGAYVIADSTNGKPVVQLLATGSEVQLALDAQAVLADEGIAARVVSMPSWELFDQQPESYQASVIQPDVPAFAVEMASSFGWERYVGSRKHVLGIDHFGASGKGSVVMEQFGFTVDNVVRRVKAIL
ncbi:transketolase [Paenibacillus terricola]|uniref:transketolase n=1 Tax=Paenibacillus terricola TaxID=2763503 RepID=UPI002964382A|nr:transketolase [Paenibacillus terricola]